MSKKPQVLKPPVMLPATMHPERNEVTLHLPNDEIEMAYGKPLTNEELERALEEARERARRKGWPEDEI